MAVLAVNGTKAIWILAALLVCAAVALALLPSETAEPVPDLSTRETVVHTPVPTTTSVPPWEVEATKPTQPSAPSVTPAEPLPKPVETAPVQRDPDAVSLGMDQVIPNAKVIPGNIVPRTDAKTNEPYLLADGRYSIRGKGTQEDPYRVSWQCLLSASDSYRPRSKEYGIPQRVALLNNAWVTIDGYLLFPLYERESEHIAIAFNQYDGCCIGLPPTAYDAIEVNLTTPARRAGGHGLFAFGSASGKLVVDPLLVENFLAGLYVMNDATLKQSVLPDI